MKSIRRHLAFWVLTVWVVCALLGGAILYWSTREALVIQFDDTLRAKADALITAAEVDDGELELDFDVQSFAGFGSAEGGDYFQILSVDGSSLLGSPSLRGRDLTGMDAGAVKLWDGRAGRAVVEIFTPAGAETSEQRDLRLIVVSESFSLVETLRVLTRVLVIIGLSGWGAVALALYWALRRGLSPLGVLAQQVQDVRGDQMGEQLDVTHVPDELQIVGGKINDLLSRVWKSLDRERRFSSHAAHEMRTPLAELRAMTELARDWPEEATTSHYDEMLQVIQEMENLLDRLALLARAEAGAEPVARENVNQEAIIRQIVARFQPVAEARNVSYRVQVVDGERGAILHTDPVLWQAVLQNLVGNATYHAPEDSVIQITASATDLKVSNSAPGMTEEELLRIFERFWRKNTARNAPWHQGRSGLGLSIVDACVKLLGGRCEATLLPGSVLSLRIIHADSFGNVVK